MHRGELLQRDRGMPGRFRVRGQHELLPRVRPQQHAAAAMPGELLLRADVRYMDWVRRVELRGRLLLAGERRAGGVSTPWTGG